MSIARFSRARPRIFVIDDLIPDPRFGAGLPRTAQLLRALSAAGADVTMWPAIQTWFNDFPVDRSVLYGASAVDSSKIDLATFLGDGKNAFDGIIVSRPHNMQLFRSSGGRELAAVASARLIYDAEALFAARSIAAREIQGAPLRADEARRLIDDELALVSGADTVLAVSAETARMFRGAGHPDVRILGYAVEPKPCAVPFDARDGFLFVGQTRDDGLPNTDSVVWFVDQVLPRIRRLLGRNVSLLLAGMMGAPSISARVGAGIDPLGVFPTLETTYARARVFVAPTRYASGIPLKVFDAAAHGIPTVMTPLLANQTGWVTERDTLVAGDPAGFADACVRLHEDAALWEHIRAGGLSRVEKDCSLAAFDGVVAQLVAEIAGHR